MASKSALPVNRKAFPLRLNAALSVDPVPLTSVKVCVDPASTSVAVNVPTIAFAALFSARLLADSAMSVGASLTSVTVMAKAFSKNRPPASVARTRTL